MRAFTLLMFFGIFVGSVKLVSLVGMTGPVAGLIGGLLLVTALFRKQIMLARRSIRAGQLGVTKKTFKKSIKLTIFKVALILVILTFIAPAVRHQAHKKFKQQREFDEQIKEIKNFMDAQKELQKFMNDFNAPVFEAKADPMDDLKIFQEEFRDWSDIVDARLYYLETSLEREDREEFDDFNDDL